MNKYLYAAERIKNYPEDCIEDFDAMDAEMFVSARELAQLVTDLSAMLTVDVVEAGSELKRLNAKSELNHDEWNDHFAARQKLSDFALPIIAKLREDVVKSPSKPYSRYPLD